MDCLTILITCLLQGTYISAGIEQPWRQGYDEGRWCMGEWCSGPMGVVKLGTRIELPRSIDADLGLTHSSFLNTNRDQGVHTAYLQLTWRPFRR